MLPPPELELTDLIALEGGVVSPGIWRCRRGDDQLVFKRCSQREIAIGQLIASLGEPLFMGLREHGNDEHGPWLLTDFHPGSNLGMDGIIPDEIHQAMGRLHARWPADRLLAHGAFSELPRWTHDRVASLIDSFARKTAVRATAVLGAELTAELIAFLDVMLADAELLAEGERGRQSLLHNDLYGMNVLRGDGVNRRPLVIDWGNCGVGPPMLDVAMSAGWDSSACRAHHAGWLEAGGAAIGSVVAEREHQWAQTVCNSIFCGDVALRAGRELVVTMLATATSAYRRYRRLVGLG